MAVAAVEERHLLKTLRWYDGFVICLANPGFLLGSLGWSVLDLGGWGAALIWGVTAVIIVPVVVLYSELAAMFPDKSGGIAIYANEGWRKYTTLVGPVATFGYWIGWSVVLSFLGLFTGYIAQAAWFPHEPYGTYAFGGAKIDNGYFSTGSVHVGLQHLIAIGLILAVWAFNIFGTRIAVAFNYLSGALLMVPLFCFTFLPFLNGDFHSSNLTFKLNDAGLAWGGWQLALVWIWIMIWSTAPEASATFAPEYKDTVNDTRKALLSSAVFILMVNTLVPIALTGGVGAKTVEAFDYVGALNKLVGSGATDFFVVVICTSFILSMNTATADGSRALYGISRDGMTIKELGRLNRFNVPGNAMSLDMAHQHPLRPLRRQSVRHPRREQHRLRARERLCHRRVRPAAQGPAELAATDQAPFLLDADRHGALCGLLLHQHRRYRLVPDRRRWSRLRWHEGEDHRLLRPCRVAASLPVPAHRPGRREAPLAGGDADHAGRVGSAPSGRGAAPRLEGGARKRGDAQRHRPERARPSGRTSRRAQRVDLAVARSSSGRCSSGGRWHPVG